MNVTCFHACLYIYTACKTTTNIDTSSIYNGQEVAEIYAQCLPGCHKILMELLSMFVTAGVIESPLIIERKRVKKTQS